MFYVRVYTRPRDEICEFLPGCAEHEHESKLLGKLLFNNITHAIEACVGHSSLPNVDKCWLLWKDDRLAVYRDGREAPS